MQWICLMRSNAGFVIIAFYPATIMLRLFLCLIVLGLLSICQAAANSKQNGVSAEAKLQQISELAAKSKGNVITLDDSTYSYYATSKPRPYSLVVLLTATHPKFRCGVCKQMDTELAVLAHSYSKSAKNDDDNKVFFVRLDYESSSKIFQSYQVNSVPLVFYLGPQHSGEKAGAEFHVNPRDRYQVPSNPDAESLASFLSDRGNVSVKIERSMIGAYIALLVLFGIILALVQPVINSLPVLLRIIQWKPLWIAVSCGVYTCAISGMIYDIIRSPQMYNMNPNTGQIQFFYPQSGSQFVVEGFVIGFLNLACAGSAALVLIFAPYFKDENNRTLGVVGGVVVFTLCFRMVRSLYIMKNMWYGRAF